MGRKSVTGGVRAKGSNRIQFDFEFEGVRYRPTLKRTPTEANLRRAAQQLEAIKTRIARGTFSFGEEFPDYRFMKNMASAPVRRTCNDVFAEFLAHTESRMSKNDLAFATVEGYRKILENVWGPKIGERPFEDVRYSELVAVVNRRSIGKKTYNNLVSALRCAFEFGYRDHPEKHNPATGLKCFRITKKDRPVIDPFTIVEAEMVIAGIHHDWGEAQANYDEFRFFTGLRLSEQIALTEDDCDLLKGTIQVTKARVMARDKDRTKTSEDRLVELCPRALEALTRQLALRTRLRAAGKIDHDKLFFDEEGRPWHDLQVQWRRWRETLGGLQIRYREPNNTRHSSVSWNLMVGQNPLRVAKNHGHGVQTMLEVYAAWIEGATESDIEAIKRAMQGSPRAQATVDRAKTTSPRPHASPKFGTSPRAV